MYEQIGINWTTIIGIAVWALIPGFIAKGKGRSFWVHYLLCFLVTPLIMTIVALIESRKE